MADRDLLLDDQELVDSLRAFARTQRYPPTPDLAPIVRERVEARSGQRGRVRPRRLAMAIAALIVLLCAATLLAPNTRRTVADWLDLPGVTFWTETTEDRPVLGGTFRIGVPVTLDEARAGIDFELLVPDLAWLDEPDEVYLDSRPNGGAVTLIFHASADVPAADSTGVGLLLSQFQGELNPGMYGKGLPDGVQLETIEINGRLAFWITGTPHQFSYLDSDGEYVQETLRLAGNTLLWQDGERTLRLESALDRDRAIEIARSMR